MRTLLLLALVLAAPLLGGCGTLCALACPVEAPASPAPLTRDTPAEAVEFLVEALESHRIRDIYESLHPALRKELGGISLAEFTSAFSMIEGDVDADARLLSGAQITFDSVHPDDPGFARVRVEAPGAGGLVGLRNQPQVTVEFHAGRFPESSATLGDLGDVLTFEDGHLLMTEPVKLAGTGNADMSQVRRVVFRNNWLVSAWKFDETTRIRLLDRMKDRRAPAH